MKALVTGAAGFTGSHLVRALVAAGHRVWATDLSAPTFEGAEGAALDITDRESCAELFGAVQPHWLFHLAGFSHVARAEKEVDACLQLNFEGTRDVLSSCEQRSPATRVVVVSSAEVYGRADVSDAPRTETSPVRPATIYALSKAMSELACHHAVSRGLDVIILRPFNQIGPGQSSDFVASAFARQIASIEAGKAEPLIRVGNLQAVRDFCDVRDAVGAYLRVAESGRCGEVYNITSTVAVSIREILTTLVSLGREEVRVETDPDRLRTLDMPCLHGSADKLIADTGLRLGLKLERTLGDVLDYWREAIANEPPR